MKLKNVFAGCCIGIFTTLAQAATDPPPHIVAASFGVFDASTPNELNFEPSKVVPRILGQRYGWVIELKTKKRSVSVREEYLLPTKIPSADTAADGIGITPLKRRSQVSQRQLVLMDGKIYGEWGVGPNEPAGHRHLQVFVENELAGDFEFDVK